VNRRHLSWALVTVLALTGWMSALQLIHMGLSFQAQWQPPRIHQVEVIALDRDPEQKFLERVKLRDMEGFDLGWRTFTKGEAAELQKGDETWVLDNYFMTPLRPETYRLSAFRLFMEFPQVVLGLALLALWRLRRLPPPAEPERATPRKVLVDDFAERSQARRQAEHPSEVPVPQAPSVQAEAQDSPCPRP